MKQKSSRPKCPHCGKFTDSAAERMLSIPEAAAELGLAVRTVYKLVSQRRLGSVKNRPGTLGGKVSIPSSALDLYRRNQQELRPAL